MNERKTRLIVDISRPVFRKEAELGERITWDRLSEMTGIPTPSLHRMNGSSKRVNLERLDMLCDVLGCEPEDLIRRVPTKD